ncbi:MAG: ribosomal RNA small subunit methyltransferase A [Erysipelotrichaceae bacterium]|nr:ribosomal RNA small subunit methyltransferase A [Erysipelotrichaceae bacterium]
MTRYISTPSRTKEILETYGLRARKGYGQNFLVDPVIVEKCALASHCQDAVIEIGPGIGGLTEQLARHSRHVTAYEVDEDLIPVLADTLKDYDNVEIILQDFLESDLEGKLAELEKAYGTVTVCANLPYYITTPVLFKLFEYPEIPYITVMVQKEVGDRFAAKPKDSAYSALSVEAQFLYDVKKLFTVPGRSFNPSPNVDSVIVQFARKETDLRKEEIRAFYEMVRACFKQRRKTLYNNLKEYLQDKEKAEEALNACGIPLSLRAQEADTGMLYRVFEEIRK